MENLKGKQILIGKEIKNGRLQIAVVGYPSPLALGTMNCVPNSVSRCRINEQIAHARLNVEQSGALILRNLKPQNVTFVNGSEIISKRVNPSDNIELGADHFSVSIEMILKAAETIVSRTQNNNSTGSFQNQYHAAENKSRNSSQTKKFGISHLEKVWNQYEEEMDRIVREQQKNAKRRMIPLMLGIVFTLVSAILAECVSLEALYITIPTSIITLLAYILIFNKKDTSYEDRKAINEKLFDNYVCPNPECRKFLGNMSYRMIRRQYSMHCPYCKCEYY
ncbi:MAG: FHA domain-containing protein [Muribaculaceae bacterium]|nr:FHA domain-containing protein [Muribaculaceae bacterium]